MGIMSNQDEFVGKRVVRDVFTKGGILLIPDNTILTREHIRLLHNHGIELIDADVAEVTAEAEPRKFRTEAVVETSVTQVSQIFEEIRESKKVPMSDLRSDVVPMIQDVATRSTLASLFTSLQSKDDYTYRHMIAVGALATLIGKWMNMDANDLMQLTTAAVLHDVGKMLIPESILNKPGKLTPEEFEEMKRHTVLGYEMLQKTPEVNERQALVALQHHERMDGGGYPYGITGEKIDLYSRIVAVADVFHAMTSNRVYRKASPFYEALFQLEKYSFNALDPEITLVFTGKMMSGLIGNTVQLTDGRAGSIVLVHPHDPLRPLVRIDDGGYVDLSKDLSVHIKQIV